jgi:hypothetical protein
MISAPQVRGDLEDIAAPEPRATPYAIVQFGSALAIATSADARRSSPAIDWVIRARCEPGLVRGGIKARGEIAASGPWRDATDRQQCGVHRTCRQRSRQDNGNLTEYALRGVRRRLSSRLRLRTTLSSLLPGSPSDYLLGAMKFNCLPTGFVISAQPVKASEPPVRDRLGPRNQA